MEQKDITNGCEEKRVKKKGKFSLQDLLSSDLDKATKVGGKSTRASRSKKKPAKSAAAAVAAQEAEDAEF